MSGTRLHQDGRGHRPTSLGGRAFRWKYAVLGLFLLVPLLAFNSPASAVAPGIRGDVDGDGFGDIISLYEKSTGAMNIWLHKGGTSGGTDPVPTLTDPVLQHSLTWKRDNAKPAVGDFDGDGKTDLIIIYRRSAGGTNFWFFKGTSGGLAAPVLAQALSNFEFDKIKHSVGDINNDGDDDIVIAYKTSTTNWWTMEGAATIGAPIRIHSGLAPKWTQIKLPQWFGDTNNDGTADLTFWHKWYISSANETSVRQWIMFGQGGSLNAPVLHQYLRQFLYQNDLMTGGSFSGMQNAAGASFGDTAIMRPTPPSGGVDLFWVWGGGPTGPFRLAFNGIIGEWDLDRIKMTASDIDGNGIDEVIAWYHKASGGTNIWMLHNTETFTVEENKSLSHSWTSSDPA